MTDVKIYRPGLNSWARMFRSEATMVARDYAGLIIPLGLPLLILVTQAAVMSGTDEILPSGHSVLGAYILPIVFVMVLATVGIINMPSFLATYRKTGVLKQLSVTPASPLMLMCTQMLVGLAQMAVGLALAYAVAAAFFDAGVPGRPATVLAVILMTAAAMMALGMIVASISPSPNSAVAVGFVLFFLFGAVGGMFGPIEFPGVLGTIADWLPVGAAVDGLQNAWIGESIEPRTWISLAATTALGVVISLSLFRWE